MVITSALLYTPQGALVKHPINIFAEYHHGYWTVDNVQNDPQLTAALKQAMKWQAYALANSNAMDGYSSSTRVETVRTFYDNALTAVEVVFALLTVGCIVMYVRSRKKA